MDKVSRSISVEGGVLKLPDEIMPFTVQIAGHGSLGKGQRTFLKHENGHLLKPLQGPPRGTRETGFYQNIYKSEEQIDKELRCWVPDFYGIKTFSVVNEDDKDAKATDEDYLILEDISENLELPNIMDIKIGSITYGPDATEKKRQHEDSKYKATKKPLGFSVLGIIVHPIKGGSEEMTRYDKTFGSHIKTEEVLNMPKVFFDYDNTGLVTDLVEIVVQRLKEFQAVYQRQRKYHIYGSSLLFAYDVRVVRRYLQGECTRHDLDKGVNIKLIDFAHVFPSEDGTRDENFLWGLENLIQVFQNFLKVDMK